MELVVRNIKRGEVVLFAFMCTEPKRAGESVASQVPI